MARLGFWEGGKAALGLQKDRLASAKSAVEPAAANSESCGLISLAESSLLLRAFEESGQGWFWATDVNGRLTYITERVIPHLTVCPGGISGVALSDLLQKCDEAQARNLSFVLTRQSKFANLVVRAADPRHPRLWSISGTPQFNTNGQFIGFRGSGADITEQRKSSDQVSRLAMYDSLTGLPNRVRMSEVLESALTGLDLHKRACAVLLLDLDRFKQVNDTLGHPAGDALLKQVADRLFRMIGDKERIFRLGGDEFQVIVRDCDDRDVLRDLGEKVIASLSEPYLIEGSRCVIGASIGIALSPDDGRTSDDLIRNADLALYAAKGNGRGCVSFYSSELLQAAEDRRVLEEDLRDALERGEIHVFYQPIVNAATNLTTGVEALVRWHHPERGSISPALFIPIAEETNLIGPLGEWILRKACHDAASWPGKLRVAVNVSPIQFTSGALPAIVTSALASSGLSPERLELEITEGVFLSDSSAADSIFASLKQIGVRLALDDFGTGYSSLGYLRTAPFDKIKIDQSFVRAATLPGSRNGAIIAAIVALAEALGMETTAEGVESQDQLALIQSLRVSHVQGYIYSHAVACDELIDRLASGNWIIPPSGPTRQRSDRVAMYRKVRVIFGNHYRSVLIRNLSETGALIEGLDDVPFGSQLIVDFGEGHLVFATISRSRNRQQGLVFDEPMVSDDHGSLRSARPVSPLSLQRAELPLLADDDRLPAPAADNSAKLEALRAKLGLGFTAAPIPAVQRDYSRTLTTVAEKYLEQLRENTARHASVKHFIDDHILPSFGHLRPDALTPSFTAKWLATKSDEEDLPSSSVAQLKNILGQLYVQAIDFGNINSLRDNTQAGSFPSRDIHERPLTREELDRLITATEASANPRLKHIVALLILTRVRQRDLLEARWNQVDLEATVWVIPPTNGGKERRVDLSCEAIDVIRTLPRWDNCPWLLANPVTQKPYRSFLTSWETARMKADLADVEIDDLRFCDVGDALPARSKSMKSAISNFHHQRSAVG